MTHLRKAIRMNDFGHQYMLFASMRDKYEAAESDEEKSAAIVYCTAIYMEKAYGLPFEDAENIALLSFLAMQKDFNSDLEKGGFEVALSVFISKLDDKWDSDKLSVIVRIVNEMKAAGRL